MDAGFIYVCGSFKDIAITRGIVAKLGELGLPACLTEPDESTGIDCCLRRIDEAAAVYVSNPRGEIGKSVSLDLGYAIARGKAIYALKHVQDPPIAHLVIAPITPEELAARLR